MSEITEVRVLYDELGTWLHVGDCRAALNNRDFILEIAATAKVAMEKTRSSEVAFKHMGAIIVGGLTGHFGELATQSIKIVRRGIVQPDEVRWLLDQVLTGNVSLRLHPNQPITWDQTFAGEVGFAVGYWVLNLFNDCDEVDYTDNVMAPDGRSASYDQLVAAGGDPVSQLSSDQYEVLERLVKEARW
jgi:hypothetical protein